MLNLSCLMLSVYVGLMNSPQIFVMLLVFQAFMVSLLSGFLNNIWYSYILFLVFLGGMLVIFIYISSLASSVKVDKEFGSVMSMGILGILLMLGLIFSESGWLLLDTSHSFHNDSGVVYIFMFNSTYYLYGFIVGYLLLALWVVCILVKMLSGPLRKMA